MKDECHGVENEGFFAWDSRVAEKWNVTILVVTRRSHPGVGGRCKVYIKAKGYHLVMTVSCLAGKPTMLLTRFAVVEIFRRRHHL